MTTTTQHGQVPEALIDLIDAYAETRHRCGGIYNAKTEAARNAVIEALSEVQALSAAPAIIREFESVLDEVDQLLASTDCAGQSAWHGRVARHVKDAPSSGRAAIAASPAEQQAAKAAPAWADQAVIEYRYTGGTHWCPLGPAECMKPDFDGVYRLQGGVFPVEQAAPKAAPTRTALPEGWTACTIEFGNDGPEEVAYGPQRMMARLAKWLGKYFAQVIAEAIPTPQADSQPAMTPETVYAAIAHGDEEHRAWLLSALRAVWCGEAVPPVASPIANAAADSQPAPVWDDLPTGAIINGRALAERLENGYNFECEAGPLRMCSDWQEFVRCFDYLVSWVESRAARAPAEQQAAPKAAPSDPDDHQILAITTAYEQGVGKGRQAYGSGKEISNPYDTAYRCDLAWQYGYEEGKEQAERIAKAAPKQEVQEPHGWLYEWTHSSATGKPDSTYTAFTTDGAHARKHDNCRAIYTAPQPAPAPLSDDAVRDAARYRWLRENWFTMTSIYQRCITFKVGEPRWSDITEEELDAAIDAALAAQGGKV